MRLFTAIAAVCGVASSTVFAMPSMEMMGLVARDNASDPCILANEPSTNASIQLSSWMECQVNGFFPYPANGAWDKAFASTFSPDVRATFNNSHQYDYGGWLELYHSVNVTLGKSFAPFKHGFISTLAIPNENGDKGGTVYMIGWEGGTHALLKRDLYFTDALFAVVKDIGSGERRVVEFRESSNIPNTAPMPEQNEWTCSFTKATR
ncbi:hypothetical protein K504DRAFT_463989 [Pleomassaria siparia CBS 279.74]|uniref:Uncharacterized protein n=1 Tax=Pleomassaria siparia CBS 279.74 TaxID=1314801 RepID=A0A6G1JQC5_9PLEO|nr:hypothetical protein K504DRAFT_463989 [Pleomassaria siparia CBS 279.74]